MSVAAPRRPAIAALALWSLAVWSTRITNIWSDAGLGLVGQLARTALAGSFTVLALLTLVALWRARHWALTGRDLVLVRTFAAWTVVVWAVRGAGIATGDHPASFIVVHLVLAVVSAALAALAWREAGRRPARRPVLDPTSPGPRGAAPST